MIALILMVPALAGTAAAGWLYFRQVLLNGRTQNN